MEFFKAKEMYMDIKIMEGITVKTQKRYELYFKQLISYFGSKTDVTTITPLDIRGYLKSRKLAPSTVNSYIRLFRAFYNCLIREGEILVSPVRNIKYMKEDINIDTFSHSQMRAIISYYKNVRAIEGKFFTNERNLATVYLLFGTGIRSGELLNLKWSDIDLVNGSMTVFGKSRKTRAVPLTDKLCKMLQVYQSICLKYLPQAEYFYSNKMGTSTTKDGLETQFKTLKRHVNTGNIRCSPHTFRHTFSREYIIAGGTVFSLQKILGHSQIETTNRYVNLWGTVLAEQNDKFNPLNNIEI